MRDRCVYVTSIVPVNRDNVRPRCRGRSARAVAGINTSRRLRGISYPRCRGPFGAIARAPTERARRHRARISRAFSRSPRGARLSARPATVSHRSRPLRRSVRSRSSRVGIERDRACRWRSSFDRAISSRIAQRVSLRVIFHDR